MKYFKYIAMCLMLSSAAFATEIAVEVYSVSISFSEGTAKQSFQKNTKKPLEDELYSSFLMGIAELEVSAENTSEASSRPWIGETLYLVVLKDGMQVGKVIQVFTKASGGEFALVDGLQRKDKELVGEISSVHKFRSKHLEKLIITFLKIQDDNGSK